MDDAGADRDRHRVGEPHVGHVERVAGELREACALVERERAERERLDAALGAAEQRARDAEGRRHALTREPARALAVAERGYAQALGAVYRDPAAAGPTIEARAQTVGWGAVVDELRTAPERFGALRGGGPAVRAAASVLAGWAAERAAGRAAVQALAPEASALTRIAEQAHDEGRAIAGQLGPRPTERALLRTLGTRAEQLVRGLAPAELRQVAQLLTAPHRALLAHAKAMVRDMVLGRDEELER